MGDVAVKVLGGFRVTVDGRVVPVGAWRHRRGADLVKLLAISPNLLLHREQLIDALWPELAPAAAAANLRKALHFARRALGAEGAIGITDGMLALFPETEVEVDAARFEAIARRALGAGDRAACAEAAAAYPGELLPGDRYEAWTAEPRERLCALYASVLRAAGLWEPLLEVDRADEQAHRELMRGYLDAGNRYAAIRQFERMRNALREELGVSPDAESVALYEKVLALDGHEPPTPSERVRALLAWGLVHYNRQELAEAERSARDAWRLAIDADLPLEVGEASALLALTAFATGRWKAVFREEFRNAVVQTPVLAPVVLEANLCFAEFALDSGDGHEQLAPFAHELFAIAEQAGSVHGRALATLLLGEIELYSGRLDSAEGNIARSAELHDGPGARSGKTLAMTRLAETALARGHRTKATRLLRSARTLAMDAPLVGHLLTRVYAAMVRAAAKPDAALRVVEKGEKALADREVCQPCSLGFHVAATHACAAAGDLVRAHGHLNEANRISGMWQTGPIVAAVWEARGAIRRAEGDDAQAAALFREAADVFAGVGRTIDEARCRAAADTN
jgi:DNA-binding SARP family transcriptional activator